MGIHIQKPRLSVLVCAVPSRLKTKLPVVFGELERQASGKSVEILCLLDNRSRTTGEKRNALLKIARGEYVTFVDDDDRVAENYVQEILGAIKTVPPPQVIVFNVWVSGYKASHGLPDRICKYDIAFEDENLPNLYKRKPNHLMVWQSAIARSVAFPLITRGEDKIWARRLLERYKKLRQLRIEKTLYYYDFDPRLSVGQNPTHFIHCDSAAPEAQSPMSDYNARLSDGAQVAR